MRYALVGCGRVAPNHVVAARQNNLQIVAICDLDQEKAEKFKVDNGLDESVKIYTNYIEMFTKENLDLVAIATWSGEHAKIALEAIRKRNHVIIEKPIALSIQDADEIIEEAEKYQVKVCTNHQNRFNPAIKAIHEAINVGKLGKLLYGTAHVRWYRGEAYYAQDAWRGTWKQDGGALMNQCIHDADLLRWMMGDEIEEVIAYSDNLIHPYIEAEDIGLAIIKFANGAYGIFEGSTNVYPDGLEETLHIFGEKGTVKAGGMSVNHIEVWNVKGEEEKLVELQKQCDEDPENVYGFGHTPLYKNMIESIEENKEPLVDGYAGKRALELILAIYESARKHCPVKLPLEEASTMQNMDRFRK
ncbi:MAG: Gfo/Idh/MocA family oxidoreductase [Lachnospiraceae bacterium]|jgi:UDP-N-acetyl-2-amino-2-deoxyglucuronate dehydrogenase|nr:Gfo/Idh/MocA family oxidoreductase [Lachnospiraceae bacterium]